MAARPGKRTHDADGPDSVLEAFAQELKAARGVAGLTQEQCARLLGFSVSVIAKVETYRTSPQPDFAVKCDEVFKSPGTFVRLRALMMAVTFEPWFRVYVDIENRATVLRSWQPLVVDGLLQTEAYARAILRAARPGEVDGEIDQLVAARMARQEIWDRQDPLPPMLSVILAEGVLRQRVGDAAVMREQLIRLAEAADNPRIALQVMPSSAGAHPGMLGPFVVASFESGPDAAYLDNALHGQVTERRRDVARVSLLYDTLRAEALSPGASTELIARMVDEWT